DTRQHEGWAYEKSSRRTKVPCRAELNQRAFVAHSSEFALNNAMDIEISLPRSFDVYPILGLCAIVSRTREGSARRPGRGRTTYPVLPIGSWPIASDRQRERHPRSLGCPRRPALTASSPA